MTRKKPPLFVVDESKPNRADELINEASESEAVRFIEGFGPIKQKCESPIEELLMAALYASAAVGDPFYRVHFMGGEPPVQPAFGGTVFFYQQAQVGPYRVDILALDATKSENTTPFRWMVIECDGHDFHERTKAQARRDKQRDRFFQSKGYKVLRYTGSEIWADPDECANEILEELACNDTWRNRDK